MTSPLNFIYTVLFFRPENVGSGIVEHEASLLLKAIHSTNLPKFVTEDIPLFERILTDLFPGLTKPQDHDKIFQVRWTYANR